MVGVNLVHTWNEFNSTTTLNIPASIYNGRVSLSSSMPTLTPANFNATLPPVAAGAHFLLNLLPLGGYTSSIANNYQVTLQAPSGTVITGFSGVQAGNLVVTRAVSQLWIFRSDGTNWHVNAIPNMTSTG